MSFTPITACRSCGSTDLFPVIDLGEQPLANAFRPASESTPLPRYPLAVVACASCGLAQLTGSVPPSEMFDTYHYFSSYSTTMVERMATLAHRLTTDHRLVADSLVVEIASNDGYLLRHYVELGVPVLGIDPARNVAEVAEANGVPTLVDYFGEGVADQLRGDGRRADIVHANNVMAHVPDINDFVAGVATVLADDGVAVIESPYVGRLVEHTEFDTIYHEHVFYHSLTGVSALFARHGLVIADVEELDIHGGSLRYFARHAGAPVSTAVATLAAAEAANGIATPAFYASFTNRVESLKAATVDLVNTRRKDGRRIAGYGAAAKGTVLLNHFGIGDDLLDYVVDRNEHKHGLVVPGTGLEVRPVETLLADQPDDVLLLAWNFAQEIMGQQAPYREAGGRFIVPIPALEVV